MLKKIIVKPRVNNLLVIPALLLLASCNSGNNAINTSQQLVVSSNDPNSTVFVAALGESAVHTYQAILVSNVAPSAVTYSISVTLPGNQFYVESNNCTQVVANQSCNILIGFAPTSNSDYVESNLLGFNLGALESSLEVATRPGI